MDRLGYKSRHGGNYSPRNHNPTNPLASAPAFHDQSAWYLKQEVPPKEHARTETDHCLGERGQSVWNCQLSDANVVAVNVRDDVTDKK